MIFDLIKHAKQLLYDNSKSSLTATNTQDAIDTLNSNMTNKFNTTQNAINTLNSNLATTNSLLVKRKWLAKKTNGTYAVLTASELGLQNVTVNVLNVNIQRMSSTGYHFVTGFGWEGSNLYVYFDGAIDTNVDVYFVVTYHIFQE